MTDDDLDRALFALPLEEPPADLHRRIMAATVLRPAPEFRQWELWALVLGVVLLAFARGLDAHAAGGKFALRGRGRRRNARAWPLLARDLRVAGGRNLVGVVDF